MAERIAMVSDHTAFEMKAELGDGLGGLGHGLLDCGYRLADALAAGRAEPSTTSAAGIFWKRF